MARPNQQQHSNHYYGRGSSGDGGGRGRGRDRHPHSFHGGRGRGGCGGRSSRYHHQHYHDGYRSSSSPYPTTGSHGPYEDRSYQGDRMAGRDVPGYPRDEKVDTANLAGGGFDRSPNRNDRPTEQLLRNPKGPEGRKQNIDPTGEIQKDGVYNASAEGTSREEILCLPHLQQRNVCKRQETCENWMKELSMVQRYSSINALPPKERITFFFPYSFPVDLLPVKSLPEGWDKKMDQAIQVVAENHVANILEEFRNPYEQSDGSEDEMGFQSDAPIHVIKKRSAVNFLEHLKYCTPLYLGFLSHPLLYFSGIYSECCYCPLDKRMKPWQTFFGLDEFLEDDCGLYDKESYCNCGRRSGKLEPSALIAHIQQKAKNCKAHQIILKFMEEVLKDYHITGSQGKKTRHVAFERLNDDNYQRTKGAVLHGTLRYVETLEKEEKKLRSNLEDAMRRQKDLELTNKDLAKEIALLQQLKEKFDARDEDELTESEEKRHAFLYKCFKRSIRIDFSEECQRQNRPMKKRTILNATSNFELSTLMEEWYAHHIDPESGVKYEFLFDDLVGSAKTEIRKQVLDFWEIKLTTVATAEKTKDDDLQAKDKGGPTRTFFTRVWMQLGSLRFVADKIEFKLFESMDRDSLIPKLDDDDIDGKLNLLSESKEKTAVATKIKAYYRAAGRFIAHALLFEKKDYGSIPTPISVLSNLYKTVLFRGLDVRHDDYALGSLIDHVGVSEKIRDAISADSSDIFRSHAYDVYFGSKKLAYGSLLDGIGVSGSVKWNNMFKGVPTASLNNILFASLEVPEEYVFDNSGNFRFIEFALDGADQLPSDLLDFQVDMEKFKAQLPAYFKEKMRSQRSFIGKFLHWATGSPYIQDPALNPNFKIIIEFNPNPRGTSPPPPKDYLPMVHTCSKDVLIPPSAYGADMKVFDAKLALSMEHTGFGIAGAVNEMYTMN